MQMDIIAERIFELEDGTSIKLLVGRPQRVADDFECVCRVITASEERTLRLYGVDGVQALLHALGIAAIEVRRLAKRRGQQVSAHMWMDLERLIPPSAK